MEYLNSSKVNFFFLQNKNVQALAIDDPKLSDEDFLNHHIFRFATPEILKSICSIHFFQCATTVFNMLGGNQDESHTNPASGDLHSRNVRRQK